MRLPYQENEPRVVIRFYSPTHEEFIPFVAYVDSGATYSIFHQDVAQLLGIEVGSGRKVEVTVGNGAKIPVFLHTQKGQFVGEQFNAVVGFSPRFGVEVNLLGQKDFFERFKICFDTKNKYLEITKV